MAAVERIITEYIVQTDKARKELNRYENDLLQADKATQNSANKTQRTLETASQKRLKLLNEEKQDLAELTARRKQAYSIKEIREYNKRISETKDRINTLESAEGKLQKRTDLLGQTFKRVAVGIAAAFTVDRVVNFTKESIKLAATSERVEQSFSKLSRPGLLNELRDAVNGTVSDLQLMQNTVKAIEFGISQDQLPTFFAFAKQQADKLGVSVDYLVNSIIDGVGRKSSLVLDNLGISATELQAEFKKTGDFAAAAANIIEQRMDAAGDSVNSTKDSIAQFNASVENLQVSFGKTFGPAVSEILNDLSRDVSDLGLIISYLNGELDGTKEAMDNATDTNLLDEFIDRWIFGFGVL